MASLWEPKMTSPRIWAANRKINIYNVKITFLVNTYKLDKSKSDFL